MGWSLPYWILIIWHAHMHTQEHSLSLSHSSIVPPTMPLHAPPCQAYMKIYVPCLRTECSWCKACLKIENHIHMVRYIVTTHLSHINGVDELPSSSPIGCKYGSAIPIWVAVDEFHCFVQRVHIQRDQNRSKDLLFVTLHSWLERETHGWDLSFSRGCDTV